MDGKMNVITFSIPTPYCGTFSKFPVQSQSKIVKGSSLMTFSTWKIRILKLKPFGSQMKVNRWKVDCVVWRSLINFQASFFFLFSFEIQLLVLPEASLCEMRNRKREHAGRKGTRKLEIRFWVESEFMSQRLKVKNCRDWLEKCLLVLMTTKVLVWSLTFLISKLLKSRNQ